MLVVSAIYVARMYEDGVEDVLVVWYAITRRRILVKVPTKVHVEGKFKAVVHLFGDISHKVVLEALEVQMEHWWKAEKRYALLCVLLFHGPRPAH